MPEPRSIDDFTDAELAAMVRTGTYTRGETFGDGHNRFLLVLAVPYGDVDGVFTVADWQERNIQVYDHNACQRFYEANAEEVDDAEIDSYAKSN